VEETDGMKTQLTDRQTGANVLVFSAASTIISSTTKMAR